MDGLCRALSIFAPPRGFEVSQNSDGHLKNSSPRFKARFEEQMDEALLEIGLYGLRLCGIVAGMLVFCISVTSPFLPTVSEAFPNVFLICMTVAAILGGFFATYRRGPRQREGLITYVVMHLFVFCRVLFIQSPSVFAFTVTVRHMLRLALCLYGLDWRWGLAWNVVHMGVTLYKAVWSSLGVREMYGSECVALLIFVEAIVCLFGVVLQRSLLVLLQTRIEAEVQFDALSSDYKVSKSLLSATCDAEVSLGHSLEILGENDRLSAILMARSSSLTSLDGRPFLNYVAESDKQRVEKFLCEGNSEGLRCAPVGTMPARMIHADLCDVLGQQFSVVILHVRTFAEVGECQHLLGIQDRDSCRRHVLPSSSPWLLQNVAFHHDEDNVKSKVSLSCTSGSAAVDDLDAIEHVMVEFDCGHPSLPIQSITVRFSEDHTAVSSLSDWFIPSARSRFEIAIEKHIASSSILPRPHLGGLWLSPPKLSPFGFSRMLSCDAEFVHNIRKEVSPEKLHKFYGVSGRTVAVIFSQFQPMDKRAPMGESVRSVHAPKGETSGGLHQEPPFEVRTHIHLQVRTYGRRTMDVQIKRTTRFRKLFKLCSEHFNFPCDQVMLAVNGEHIDLDDCAEKLDLQDGDIIQMLQRLSDTDRMGYSHCVELSRLEM